MRIFYILFFMILFLPKMDAQVKFGTDIFSRYVWRGIDFGNSPSFQPALSFSKGGFTAGTWGAYSFAGVGDVFSEHDLYLHYSHETNAGNFGLIFTDYYFPSAGLRYFNYKDSGEGAHILEGGFLYSGPSAFPISLSAYLNFYNDIDNSIYLQTGYSFSVEETELSFFAGASAKESTAYGTSKFAFINVGLTASKSLKLSDEYELPLYASFIINPDLEQSYLIFGLHL